MKKKISILQCILTCLYISCYIASNIITGRQILLPFNISSAGGLLIFPITYILSDIFSEVYGYKWSRFTCYISFFIQLLIVIIFSITINLPYPNYYNNSDAFINVLGNTPRILVASYLAYILGDFVNDIIFQKMKNKHLKESKGFSYRAITSSFFGECIDSLIFYPIAFLGAMPINTLVIMIITQVVLKTLYEIIILPFTNLIMKKVKKEEQKCTNLSIL